MWTPIVVQLEGTTALHFFGSFSDSKYTLVARKMIKVRQLKRLLQISILRSKKLIRLLKKYNSGSSPVFTVSLPLYQTAMVFFLLPSYHM